MSTSAWAMIAAAIGAIVAPVAAAALYAPTGAGEGLALALIAFIAGVLYPVSLPFLIVPFVRFARAMRVRTAGVRFAAVACGLMHPIAIVGAAVALDSLAAGTSGVGPGPRLLAVAVTVTVAGAAVAWAALSMGGRIAGREGR